MLTQEIDQATPDELHAYLAGASRDGYPSKRHRTYRFTQANEGWLRNIATMLARLQHRSWLYREGRRSVFVLETSYRPRKIPILHSEGDVLAYVAGYFDAEGGMPHSLDARLYFQFVQKDRADLLHLKEHLHELRIWCGGLHNPSARVDPHYWRFFVSAVSHRRFLEIVRSWHPAKRMRMIERRIMQGPD